MAATAAQRTAMDAAVAEVRRLYATARTKAEDIRARDARLFSLVDDAELQVAKAIEDLAPQIQTWESTRYRDAVNGQRADGSAYTVARFLELGKDLASAARLYTQEAWNASLFAVVEQTVAATKEDVAEAANPLNWPAWLKVAAVVAVVVGAVVVAREVRAVRGLLGGGA